MVDHGVMSFASTPNEPTYRVVWPRSASAVSSKQPALRLTTLDNKRIGLVWDYMFRGDELFSALQIELQRRFVGVEVVGYDVFGNIHGPDEAQVVGELPSLLASRGVDAVVCGVGC
jgi:hypothetical protein